MCEQPQQGPRDIWTQIYPIEHAVDRRRAIVPKWLLNAANQQNVATLPKGRSLAGGGARGRSSYLALLALQPGESAGGRQWVSNTPARTERLIGHSALLPTVLATPELMLHPENRVSWLPGAIGRIIGNELKIDYLIQPGQLRPWPSLRWLRMRRIGYGGCSTSGFSHKWLLFSGSSVPLAWCLFRQ